MDNATSASAFLGEPGGGHPLAAALGGNTVLSDLTCNNNNVNGSGCFLPRKRARVGDVAGAGLLMDLEGQRSALLPAVPVPVSLPTGNEDVQSRLLCCAAASTSGRVAPVSQGLLSHLYRHGVEIDALVRIEVR